MVAHRQQTRRPHPAQARHRTGTCLGQQAAALRGAGIRLNALQRRLEAIYEVEAGLDVEDFVFSDPELASRLDTSANPRSVKEKLLLRQDGDDLDVALYLAPEVLDHLREEDPTERLHAGNFDDFLLALEGVSHFLYLIWSAAYDKAVSLVELELQAEVDKYVTSAALLGQQRQGYVPPRLHSWLFDAPVFDSALRHDELRRYRDATHYAAKYCRHLQNRYRGGVRGDAVLSELRRFYRMPQGAKFQHIGH